MESAVANIELEAPGAGRAVSILGVPLSYGQSKGGVHLGPAAIRVAGLAQRITSLGYEVNDRGDLPIQRSHSLPGFEEKLKYLNEIYDACNLLATQTEEIADLGDLPVTIGGDHSIAIGSLSGVVKSFRKRDQRLGLVYLDAHADMNTPDTTPSGNIHGMPLAVLLGYGAPELVNVGGFSPKFDPKLCAHLGARDLDPGERQLIRKLGLRFLPCGRSTNVVWLYAWTRPWRSRARGAADLQLLSTSTFWIRATRPDREPWCAGD